MTYAGGYIVNSMTGFTNLTEISYNISDTAVGPANNEGIYIEGSNNLRIYNNVLYGSDNHGIELGGGDNIIIKNNISAYNTGRGISANSITNTTADYNSYYSNTAGNYNGISAGANDKTADPLFNDRVNGDFTLQGTSTLINAGTSLGFTRDINHNPVNLGSTVDIGAHEQ
jgi:parallel beta-helix repeat protein